MPAAKKKCICQLCTCGRHMCPHRKKEQLVLGSEQTSAKSLSREDKRKQRKQWEVPNDKQDLSLRNDQLNTTFVLSESTSLATALTVDDKGNSKSSGLRSESKSWSAKQTPKTLPIRRPDNLKSEGSADFTTTHQQDFKEKKSDSYVAGSFEASSSTVQAESWNKKQIPRTQKIKKADTLTFTGPLNLETTHQSEYSESILKDKSALGESNLDQTYQRPKTSLKLSGEFQSDSSYQQAFTHKRAEDGVKVQKGVSKGHLKPEGEMTFDTTSLDYNVISTHVSRASEKGDGSVVLKPKRSRPQSEIKIASGPISDETTLVSDFKRWNVEKPTRHKPADTLQIGDGEETDSVSTRRNADSLSRFDASKIETSMSDHANWKVTRPVVQRPQNNLKPEGDFHFDTTHDIDYNSRSKRTSVLAPLTERTETESIGLDERFAKETVANESIIDNAIESRHVSEIRDKEKHKDIAQKAMISTVDGAMEQEVQANISADGGPTKQEIEANVAVEQSATKQEMLSDIANRTEQKVYEDNDLSQNEEQGHYVTWDEIRSKPIRPHSNLRQEGEMQFNTTNRSEFISRSMERVKGIRPKTSTKLFDGDFDATTMNQVMFSNNQMEKVSPIRPVSNLHVEKGGFIDETTSSREFQPWKVERPSLIIPRSNLAQEGTMDFTTTNNTEFEEKRQEKVSPIRPTTTNKISGGDLELTTTNKVMHSEFLLERVQKIVPQSTLRMNSGVFDSETTNMSQFQEWEIDRPKPIRPVPNLTQEGSMDFTTMNQMQFEEKPIEKVTQFRPHTSSKITGDFEGVTTNQIMFAAHPSQRPNMIKPKGNIEVEKGKFATDTTNHTEFQQWQQSKPDPVTPRNNLQQEGSRDFTTTNQVQYGAKLIDRVSEIRPKTNTKTIGEFDGTTTNQVMFQDSPREKLKAIRPQNNIQLEKGNFNTETTNNQEYQKWEYSKPSPIKPHSSMRHEGSMDFTTTNDTDFMGKTAEKLSPIKPSTMTKIEGKFEGITTNQAMFKSNTIERVKGKRPTTNIHIEKGKIENQTTASREFQQWEINKPEQVKPTGNLIQEGEMDFTTSNQTDFARKTITKVEAIRPHASSPVSGDFDGTTTNQVMFQGRTMEKVHDIRPKNNLTVDSGQFNEETTTSKEYGYKRGNKLEAIKPKSSLTQEGQFDFITSNQTQFEEKPINKVSQIRPKTETKTSDEKFDSITTNQAMFQTPVINTVHEIRPSDNLHVEGGKFQNQTTSSDEYQQWKVQKPTAFQLASSLKQEGSMQFETTNNAEFKERSFDRVQQIRPKTTNKISEGEFESTTTNQMMFQQPSKLERVKPIRQQNNLQVESGKFDKETTNSRDFRQWVKMENKDSQSKRKSQAAGVRTQIDSPVTKKDTESQQVKVENEQSGYQPWKLNDESTTMQAQSSKGKLQTGDHIDVTNIMDGKSTDQNQHVNTVGSGNVAVTSTNVAQQLDRSSNKNEIQIESSQKTMDIIERKQIKTESTMASDYAGKQTTKVRAIIPSGNISNEGEMNFSTTSQSDFVRQTGSRYKHENNNLINNGKSSNITLSSTNADQLDRSSNKIGTQSPQRTINTVERKQQKMESTSTMASDYAGKQTTKTRAIIPSGNISHEGEMSFSTTSQTDYVRQTGSRYKQENAHLINNGKSGNMSPSSPNADQLDRSPKIIEFQSPRKTMNTIERKQQKMENSSTMSSDYAGKQTTKTRAIIPSGNISNEGEMTFSTTSKSDYVRQTGSRNKLEGDNSKSSEARGRTQSNIVHQDSNLNSFKTSGNEILKSTETQVKGESKAQNEIAQFKSSGASMSIIDSSPQNAATSKSIRRSKPDDNLKIESVPFDGTSTTKTEFTRIEGRRSSSKKPSESLKQEGKMVFNTTSNDYSLTEAYNSGRDAVKAKSKKDQRGSLGQSGAMDFHTTSNSSYTGNFGSKSKNLRPQSSIKLGGDETSYESMSSTRSNPETTSTRQYQNATSTSRDSYVGHTPTRTRAYRPTTSQRIGEGSFEGQTTSRVSFGAQERVEKSKAIKPANHNILNTENGSTGGTTYRNSFEAVKGHHCPVLDLQAGRSSFTVTEEKNGHIFYAQQVQG